MRVDAALLILALALPTSAAAQTNWDDPTLAEAVRDVDLVVLARASAVAKNGAAYVVEKTLKGPERDGDRLAITGLHSPDLSERPAIDVGDRAYLLLYGDAKGEGFVLPTPTFGRFVRKPIGGKDQVVLSLGGPDTFSRVAIPAEQFELLVGGLAGRPAPALLSHARTVLADVEDGDPLDIYVALEVVAHLGSPEDAPLALQILRSSRFAKRDSVRVRMAALRTLGRQGGPSVVPRLLAWLETDPRPEVRSVAASMVPVALGPKPDTKARRRACERLAKMALALPYQPTRFGNAQDPRRNFVPSPLAASLLALAALNAEMGTRPALRALERDHEESIKAGLAFFAKLGARGKAPAIIRRMRADGSRDAYINRLFAETLRGLTGEAIGSSKAAWLAWSEADGPK